MVKILGAFVLINLALNPLGYVKNPPKDAVDRAGCSLVKTAVPKYHRGSGR